MMYRDPYNGFSLVELVIVIAIAGIVSLIGAQFIVSAVEGYDDQTRRAALVDHADTALRRMQQEIRQALPNSVRVSADGNYLEFMPIVAGGRYRHLPGGGFNQPDDRLQFNQPDDSFNITGPFRGLDGDITTSTLALAVYSLGVPGADPYSDDVLTPVGTTIDVDTAPAEDRVTMAPAHQFPFESPQQRIYLTDQPVSFRCNTGAGRLQRYAGYGRQAGQPQPPGVAAAVLAEDVTACAFSYNPGTATRSALVTIRVTLSRNGESVSLVQQVHIANVP